MHNKRVLGQQGNGNKSVSHFSVGGKMFKWLMRFLGMYAPSRSIRVAMYRKAGVRIGKISEFGSHIFIDIYEYARVSIGDNVILAGFDQILTHSALMSGYNEKEDFRPVVIKDGARIGVGVIILAGVTIGQGSVIGAGAVVTTNIPPYCLAVGVPAKPVKYYKSEKDKGHES
jgi:acetyltransferase-like isoleucine patch superfamily enzyme